MADKITTLHPELSPTDNLYPNIIADNIPNGVITAAKLADGVGDSTKVQSTWEKAIKDKVVQNDNTTEIGGNLEVDGTVQINSDADLMSNLSVSGSVVSTGDVTTNADLEVGGHVEVTGSIATHSNLIIDSLDNIVDSSGNKLMSGVAFIGGISFVSASSSGTYTDGYLNATIMNCYPFNQLSIVEKDSYTSAGVATGNKDRFLQIPNFYYMVTRDDTGSLSVKIANYKVNSNYKHILPDEIKYGYLGVYKSTLMNSYMTSSNRVSEETMPLVSTNQVTALGECPYYYSARGLVRSEYEDYRVRGAYDLLSIIYLGTRNTQDVYRGICDYAWNTDVKTSLGDDYISGVSGYTDTVLGTGVVSGEITTYASGKRPFKLLGVENPYGLVWENMYGLYHKDGIVYAYKGIAPLSSSEISPSDTNTKIESLGIQMPTSNGYQKAVADANGYLVPTSIGGASSTYNGDYYYYASGWRISFVGGNLDYGSSGGLFFLGGGSGFGYANASIGFRLSFLG